MKTQDRDVKKRRRAALSKMAILLAFTVLVWLFLTIAWFTMNRETSTSGMGVKVGTNEFEIRVSGDNIGARNYTQSGTGNTATYSGSDILNFASLFSKFKDGVVSGTFYDTDASNQEIKWRLTTAYDTKEDKGLGPGSEGVLTFWIVSKKEGTLDPSFSINLEGYVAPNQHKNDNGSYEVTESDMAKITTSSDPAQIAGLSHLNGHILFFNHRDGEGTTASPYTYTGLLDKDGFSLSDVKGSAQTVHVGDTIQVDLYWVWPNTLGQMVLTKTENSNRTPIFTEVDVEDSENPDNPARLQAKADIQDYVLQNITSIFDISKMKFEPDVSTDAAKIVAVKDMLATSTTVEGETVYSFDAETASSNLTDLSSGYNNADQKIGTNVNYVLIALQVEQ